jgi:hypothetical protein
MPALILNLKPSKTAFLLLFILGAASLLLPIFFNFYLGFKLLLTALSFCYVFYLMKEAALSAKHSIIGLRKLPNGEWYVQKRDTEVRAILRADSTLTHLVSVLHFHHCDTDRIDTCLLFPDSLAANQYRAMLVLIKTEPNLSSNKSKIGV